MKCSIAIYNCLEFNTLYSAIVFNWNHFEMRLLNLRINFYLLWGAADSGVESLYGSR